VLYVGYQGKKVVEEIIESEALIYKFLGQVSFCDGLSLTPHAQLCLSCIATRHSLHPCKFSYQDLGCVNPCSATFKD
jgi:hypothetical protein